MKKKIIKILKICLPLLLGIFLVWYSIQSATARERQELLDNIVNADPFWIILSIIFGTLGHVSRAYRWKFMLEPMGYRPRFTNSFMAVMVGYLANFGVPRSGEILRAVTLSSYEEIPFEKAFGTIISERIADMLVLLFIVGFALVLQTEHLLNYFNTHNINPLVTTGILLGLAALGVLILQFIKKSQLSFIIRLRKMARGLLEGMKSILKMKQKWAFIFHTLFIWGMYLLMFYVLIFAIPETAGASPGMVLAAFVVGAFAVSATNGGIGIYPVAVGALLVLFGISKQDGEAFGWITWGSQTLVVLILGGLSFIFLPVLNRKK